MSTLISPLLTSRNLNPRAASLSQSTTPLSRCLQLIRRRRRLLWMCCADGVGERATVMASTLWLIEGRNIVGKDALLKHWEGGATVGGLAKAVEADFPC